MFAFFDEVAEHFSKSYPKSEFAGKLKGEYEKHIVRIKKALTECDANDSLANSSVEWLKNILKEHNFYVKGDLQEIIINWMEYQCGVMLDEIHILIRHGTKFCNAIRAKIAMPYVYPNSKLFSFSSIHNSDQSPCAFTEHMATYHAGKSNFNT